MKAFGAENIKAFKELTEWLGNLPVQRVAQVNGNRYALAHAVFDNEMYQWSPQFNLKEAQDYYHTFCILNKEMFNMKQHKLNAQTLAILRENSLYNEMFKDFISNIFGKILTEESNRYWIKGIKQNSKIS